MATKKAADAKATANEEAAEQTFLAAQANPAKGGTKAQQAEAPQPREGEETLPPPDPPAVPSLPTEPPAPDAVEDIPQKGAQPEDATAVRELNITPGSTPGEGPRPEEPAPPVEPPPPEGGV